MTDPTLQKEWDELRLRLFLDVVEAEPTAGEVWDEFLSTLTTAYDYKVPPYSHYRALRTFAVARWPLLKTLCWNEEILTEVTAVLRHTIDQKQTADADALEVQMELLRQLLEIDQS